MVVLATHTPPIRVRPGPQPKAIWVITPSGCGIGAGAIASADVAIAKAKPAITIDLIISRPPFFRGFFLTQCSPIKFLAACDTLCS
jgi:hypothetical protein